MRTCLKIERFPVNPKPRRSGPYLFVDTLPLPKPQQPRCPVCPPDSTCELYADEKLDVRPRATDRAVKRAVWQLYASLLKNHELRDYAIPSLHARVSVRFDMRIYAQQPRVAIPTLTVLHVEVEQPHRRQYNFSRFMRFTREWAKRNGYPIYVPNVSLGYLKRKLLRDQYTIMHADSGAKSSIDAYDWCLDNEHPLCFCQFFLHASH